MSRIRLNRRQGCGRSPGTFNAGQGCLPCQAFRNPGECPAKGEHGWQRPAHGRRVPSRSFGARSKTKPFISGRTRMAGPGTYVEFCSKHARPVVQRGHPSRLDTLAQALLRGRNSHPGGRWLNYLRSTALRQVNEELLPCSDAVENRGVLRGAFLKAHPRRRDDFPPVVSFEQLCLAGGVCRTCGLENTACRLLWR